MSTAGDGAYRRPRRRRMDITKQSPRASVAHQRFLFNGEKTCIDCHKGIAQSAGHARYSGLAIAGAPGIGGLR